MRARLQTRLKEGLLSLGLDFSVLQQKQLLDYLALLSKWNKVYNLTAICNEDEMLTHHLLDSLAVIAPLQKHLFAAQPIAARVLDVGAGAGLPGVVIAICLPDVVVVCVDAVGKKASFVKQVAAELGLKNLQGLHSRVEALTRIIVSEGFDVITSRAFAALGDFVALTKTCLKLPSGVWMAMKARGVGEEAVNLPDDVKVFHVEPLRVPFLDEERNLVWISRLH